MQFSCRSYRQSRPYCLNAISSRTCDKGKMYVDSINLSRPEHRVKRVAMAYIPPRWKSQPRLVRVGGARPPPFARSTITYKVVVFTPAERADTLPLFLLYPYMYSAVLISTMGVNVSSTISVVKLKIWHIFFNGTFSFKRVA